MAEEIQANNVCTCNHTAPPLRVLRQPSFCRELARFYRELGLSGPAILYWIEAQLYDFHDGELFDWNGKSMEIADDPVFTDNAWKADERRTVLRILERSHKEFKYLLHKRMVPAIMLMYFARQIYLCRTSGCCSKT